jgi:hypothetical protein
MDDRQWLMDDDGAWMIDGRSEFGDGRRKTGA